jgi:Tfp pilus assembly protein PilZ
MKLPSGDYEYETNDVSLEGIFVECTEPLSLQSLVRFEIQLPERSESLQIIGLVAHTISELEAERHGIEPGMGIRLFSLRRQKRQLWREYVLEEYDKREQSRDDLKNRDTPEVQIHLPEDQTMREFVDEKLGEGSAFVRTADLQEPGSRVLCNIIPNQDDEALQLEAKVVDIVESPREQRGMRLAIKTLSDEQQETLEAFLGN